MLHLPDVTLVLVAGDIIAPTVVALDEVLEKFNFSEVLLFIGGVEGTLRTDARVQVIWTTIKSSDDAGRFHHRGVIPHLKTDFAMFMEWDGYPVHPDLWDDRFLDYDYIGAVWPWFKDHTVGNSGFCLRSRKLMTALVEYPYIEPVDIMTGRHHRLSLERDHGIKFAPEEVAERFSRELWPAGKRTFGFHGIWNMMDHMTDAEVKARLGTLAPAQWRSSGMATMPYHALWSGRRKLFQWLTEQRVRMNHHA